MLPSPWDYKLVINPMIKDGIICITQYQLNWKCNIRLIISLKGDQTADLLLFEHQWYHLNYTALTINFFCRCSPKDWASSYPIWTVLKFYRKSWDSPLALKIISIPVSLSGNSDKIYVIWNQGDYRNMGLIFLWGLSN